MYDMQPDEEFMSWFLTPDTLRILMYPLKFDLIFSEIAL